MHVACASNGFTAPASAGALVVFGPETPDVRFQEPKRLHPATVDDLEIGTALSAGCGK